MFIVCVIACLIVSQTHVPFNNGLNLLCQSIVSNMDENILYKFNIISYEKVNSQQSKVLIAWCQCAVSHAHKRSISLDSVIS